jgi:energy-coupling factor transporter ATP-binding protein EcfA2
MIEVHQVTKRFGPVTAVDGLSFTVRPGRVTGFLGPNGAGKTTTLRIILGLDAPAAGHALVEGAVLAGGFYLAVVALLGLGLGVITRSTAAAVAAAVALTYLIPEILSLLPSPWNGRIDRFLPLTAVQQLVSLHPKTGMFAPARIPQRPGRTFSAWYVGIPSTTVASTWMSVIRPGSACSGLASRTTKSASLPGWSEPISSSRCIAVAASVV